jgi:hypothetical protein
MVWAAGLIEVAGGVLIARLSRGAAPSLSAG